jgi:hypothetical protein
MSRADEIAQGLREPGGALTFPLDCLDYGQGFVDFKAGTPPPRVTSASYDLGRNRARQAAEDDAEFKDKLRADSEATDARVRALLSDRPDLLAEYDAKMREISTRRPA